ncbi:MAG TPA: 30S ribosomal protein S20 [Magnetospirillaceae bacterium]|nr:30S ribosomal protein S20 [Magnetospirillaceae bacterium]
MEKKQTSAEKRHIQSEKRRVRNKMAKSEIRTRARKVTAAVQGKDKSAAEAALKAMVKDIDTASRKGIVKCNTAARKKSRMQRLVNTLSA